MLSVVVREQVRRSVRVLGCLGAVATLVACGGSAIATHSVSVPSGSTGSTASAVVNGQVAQPFALTFARSSAITKIGIASSAEANSPEHDVTVGATASGCAANGTREQCSFTLTMPWGPQTLTVTTYGATVTHSQLRVGLGGTRVALATGSAVAQISLDLADSAFSSNLPETTSLYVTARDADGNTIVGSLGTTITIASTDTSGGTSLSATTVAASTDSPLTVTFNGTAPGPSVTFTATAPGVAASAITSAILTFTAPQIMYVGAQRNILEFARSSALGDNVPVNRISLLGYIPFEAQPDGQGNLLVLAGIDGGNVQNGIGFTTSFLRIPISASGPTTPTPYGLIVPVGQTAYDFGLDSSGNVYVLATDGEEDNATSVSVFAPGATTPTRVIQGPATQLGAGLVNSISVSNGGVVAVNQTIANYNFDSQPAMILIFAAGAANNVAPARTISGSATGLHSWGIGLGETYVAWFPDGSLGVSDFDITDVTSLYVFAPGAGGNAAPVRTITGGATGINVDTQYLNNLITNGIRGGPASGTVFAQNGLSVDNASRMYVSVFGSSLGLPSQIVRFDSTANGNAVPSAVLAGSLTGLGAPGKLNFANAVLTPNVPPAPSVSGDFLAIAANRGWNYSVVPAGNGNFTPSPPVTVTLYADPQLQGTDHLLVALFTNGTQADATGGQVAAYMSTNSAQGGYTATGYYSVDNFAGGPIPGGLQLVLPSLTKGQSWTPYPGLTANVIEVANNLIGSGACSGGTASFGATVQYTFGLESERISYVPGCGITHMVTDNGTQITLTSIGSYPTLGQLAEAREPASLRTVSALRSAWSTVFSPWHR